MEIRYYGDKITHHIAKTPEGFLICQDVPISRTGYQTYLSSEMFDNPANGRRAIPVYRPAEEVFDIKSLASFEGKPVTNEHPDEDVTPENYSRYSCGHVQNVHVGTGADSNKVLADLYITDPHLIDLIQHGKREISCGYYAEERRDASGRICQTRIRGNHVAVVKNGRAGKNVCIRDRNPFTFNLESKMKRRKKNYWDEDALMDEELLDEDVFSDDDILADDEFSDDELMEDDEFSDDEFEDEDEFADEDFEDDEFEDACKDGDCLADEDEFADDDFEDDEFSPEDVSAEVKDACRDAMITLRMARKALKDSRKQMKANAKKAKSFKKNLKDAIILNDDDLEDEDFSDDDLIETDADLTDADYLSDEEFLADDEFEDDDLMEDDDFEDEDELMADDDFEDDDLMEDDEFEDEDGIMSDEDIVSDSDLEDDDELMADDDFEDDDELMADDDFEDDEEVSECSDVEISEPGSEDKIIDEDKTRALREITEASRGISDPNERKQLQDAIYKALCKKTQMPGLMKVTKKNVKNRMDSANANKNKVNVADQQSIYDSFNPHKKTSF